jgi:hypothetical protein
MDGCYTRCGSIERTSVRELYGIFATFPTPLFSHWSLALRPIFLELDILEEIFVPFSARSERDKKGRRKYRGGDSQGGKIADIDDRNGEKVNLEHQDTIKEQSSVKRKNQITHDHVVI